MARCAVPLASLHRETEEWCVDASRYLRSRRLGSQEDCNANSHLGSAAAMELVHFACTYGLGFRNNNKVSALTRRRSKPFRCEASKSKWAERLFTDFHPNESVASFSPPLPTERKVTLPIDLYQVLGAETHYLGDGIKRAYEARVRRDPEEGFSEEAIIGRRQILQTACETLANPRSRGDYNQGLIDDEAATLMREVPWNKVPGALCLLQEVGESEVVLQVGQCLLKERLPKSFKQDVVLAMALAYVDVSREAMAKSPPDVVKSCEVLERALKLLQEGGGSSLAPDLQEQIDETLDEITPRCVLELLALPLDDEHQARRKEGLRGVQNILWAVGKGGAVAPVGGFTREEFMSEAFLHMTAAEQVDLFTATPSSIPAERFEVYAAALAHVAEGFVGKKPHFIQEADALFLQLQQTSGTSIETISDFRAAEQELDFTLERGMCALLLGELDDCRTWLGLDSEKSPYRDPPIVDFVLSNSDASEEDDILPGLCKLLESWLGEVVFPRFKDTRALQFKLGDYYDDPRVLSYLERLEKGRGSPLEAAAAIVRIGAGAGAALDNVKASAIQTLQKVFPLKGRVRHDVKAHGIPTISSEVQSTIDLPNKEYAKNDGEENAPSEMVKPLKESYDENGGSVVEEESFQLVDKIRSFGVQFVCVGVVIGALAVVGLRSVHGQSGSTKLPKEMPSLTTITGSSDKLDEGIPKMDARLAENLVRKWQASKSQALGPNHAISQLSEILDGQMLKVWTERANDIAQHGQFWEYSLLGLTIDSVTISKDGRRAMVEATLQEAARLIDNNHPEYNDSYRSTYTTRYEITNANGNWKITDGAVLRS